MLSALKDAERRFLEEALAAIAGAAMNNDED
jgi:hypothetical protein